MNWILALTIFFIGFGLGRSIKFLKSISVSMKTVLIAQFQSLLMVLKSTEHIATLRMWEEKTAEGIDEVRQAFKDSIDESKELTVSQKEELILFFDKKYTEELKRVWNLTEEWQREWQDQAVNIIKGAMYPYASLAPWSNWNEAMQYLNQNKESILAIEEFKNRKKSND
jgi:hypothetical protein